MMIPEELSVTKEGDVFDSNGELVEPFLKNGYRFVYHEGQSYKIANMVATLYVPNPDDKPIVDHKDRDKTNDHYKNLRWTTLEENSRIAHERVDLGAKGKAYGYVRVSTDRQAGKDKFGIKAQKEEIKQWAKENGYEIESFFIDDGYSGNTQNRPDLQRLLKTVKAKYAPIIVAKFDRWSRDTFLHLYLEKEIIKAGSKLLSVAEDSFNDPDDPTQSLMREITMAFAKFESQRITARMAGGRRQKAEEGKHATGRIPFGFKKNGEGYLVPKGDEMEVVNYIFELRDEGNGLSLRKLADKLNGEGLTNKKGNRWNAKSVSYILKNEKYKGIFKQTVQGEVITTANKNLAIQ